MIYLLCMYSRQKYYCYHQNVKSFLLPFKNGNFFNIVIAILDFSVLPLLISIFCMSFVYWFMASFLYCFPYSYCSSNYCDSNSCRTFTLLKALAKSNGNLIPIAFKSEKERQLSLSR